MAKQISVQTKLLTTNQAAELLECSSALIRKAAKKGILPAKRFSEGNNSRFYFSRDDLLRFREQRSNLSNIAEPADIVPLWEAAGSRRDLEFLEQDINRVISELLRLKRQNMSSWRSSSDKHKYTELLAELRRLSALYPYSSENKYNIDPLCCIIGLEAVLGYFEAWSSYLAEAEKLREHLEQGGNLNERYAHKAQRKEEEQSSGHEETAQDEREPSILESMSPGSDILHAGN